MASVSALTIAGCATSAPGPAALDDATTADTLARMARRLYPHDALPDSVYAEVAAGVSAAAAADPAASARLRDGARTLQASRSWRSGGAAGETEALRSIENTPFFTAMRSEVQSRLYVHPAVWAMLGYPGPSLPFGGYVDKGFDDIDWLPA